MKLFSILLLSTLSLSLTAYKSNHQVALKIMTPQQVQNIQNNVYRKQLNYEASKINYPQIQGLRKKTNKTIREEALLFIADPENKDENVIKNTNELFFLKRLFKKNLLNLPIQKIGAYQELCFRIKRDNPELTVFIVNPEDLNDIQNNQKLQEIVNLKLAQRGFITPENLPAPTDWEIVIK